MNETSFRSLMRDAIGEEPMRPWLSEAVRSRIAEPAPKPNPARWVAMVAACLAVAVAAIAFAPRLLNHSTPVVPATSPLGQASPTPVSAFGCRLPVMVGSGIPGYVDTKSGVFTPATIESAGMPSDSHGISFDATYRYWVPEPARQVSPDGTAYVYVPTYQAYPGTSLRIHELGTGADRSLGIFRPFGDLDWRADGIHAALPAADSTIGGTELLIDPASGASRMVRMTPPALAMFQLLPGDPQGTDGTSFHPIGTTDAGQVIWWFFNLDRPGAADWVFYETAPGQRVYIYKGKQGDPTGFDPGLALGDRFGIWFSDYGESQFVWHWDSTTGLRKINVTGLPNVLEVVPAGPCF